MIFLFIAPFGFGLANYLVPLQIGAPDVAFPRLNAYSYWMYLLGGPHRFFRGFADHGGAASDMGWYAYAPLSELHVAGGAGEDLWISGVTMTSISSIATSINYHRDDYSSSARPACRCGVYRFSVGTCSRPH